MGAGHSSNANGSHGRDQGRAGEAQTCYYELLGIERQASDEEIKKAYRKRALELHPDRNFGNVEETTKLFAELQSAYEVLSDPQERAWYDSHRAAILRHADEPSTEQFEHDVRVTTAEDVLRMFARFSHHMDFSDSPSGFYTVFGDTFETLAKEEDLSCKWEGLDPVIYPSFGHAGDDYEDTVKPFYAAWGGFVTSKSFSWKDVYRVSEAPDRRVRRMMEKENKRFREEGIHEFNDSVRSLVAFVKRRDPRHKLNSQSEADRQKIMRDAAAAQASRSRAANQAKMGNYNPPGWMEPGQTSDIDFSEDEQDHVEEQLECIICRKTFKSEKQYEAHEKSKKHTKAVQQIQREMQKEDKHLSLHSQESHENSSEIIDGPEFPADSDQADIDPRNIEFPEETRQDSKDQDQTSEESLKELEPFTELTVGSPMSSETMAERKSNNSSPLSPHDNECSSGESLKGRTDREENAATQNQYPSLPVEQTMQTPSAENLAREPDPIIKSKIGKAKEKRAKKAAQTSADQNNFNCVTCQATFASKNRLFDHINKFNHAQPNSNELKKARRTR